MNATERQAEGVSMWVMGGLTRAHDAGKRELTERVKGYPGLYLISRPKSATKWGVQGSQSFVYAYWNPETHKNAKMVFEPGTTFARAKELATQCRRLVREKRDPKPVITKLKKDVDALLSGTWDGYTVDELFREYASNYNYRPVNGHVASQGTIEYYAARLGLLPDGAGGWKESGNGVLSKWKGKVYATRDGDVKLDDRDADAILRDMAPSVANKTVEALKRFGRWAVYAKRANTNPFAELQPFHEEDHRDRLFSNAEIKLLWQITETTNDPLDRLYGKSAQLMLLTVVRPGAARRARWVDFDLGNSSPVWYLPPEERRKRQTKRIGRHAIPLSPMAVTLLQSLPREGEYVFSTDGGRTPIPDDGKAVTRAFRKRMETSLGRDYASEPEANEDDNFTGAWQWRDLRRTAATGLSRIKIGPFSVPPHVIEAIQDHAKGKVSAAYLKNTYLDEARQVLEAWSAQLARIAA
ncbi:integrase [Mesorhizobium sp. L-8-10]|uniref:site-specific integrase n=1 Tax=Mesorhizobium sp. L-8-10 TaxID=2744523 RepID=UPI001925BEEE|nr:site-specific integrase [Mesorhizobium sp. L-8-10]BCH33960.1 integrase [Mesorhizobium sp. L-8-10]